MSLLKLIADNQFSIFESILTPLRHSLSLDMTTDSTIQLDSMERCNDLMEVLNHLVATQSREQWSSISHQPGASSSHGPSSNVKGLQVCHQNRMQLVDIL
jgi:hypothetical protein